MASPQPAQDDKLCKSCTTELMKFVRRSVNHSLEPPETAEIVLQRTRTCTLCALLAKHVSLLKDPSMWRIDFEPYDYCKFSLPLYRSSALGQLPQRLRISARSLEENSLRSVFISSDSDYRGLVTLQRDGTVSTPTDWLTPSSEPTMFLGRRVDPLVNRSLVRLWITKCDKGHEACQKDIGDTAKRPALVIDVRQLCVGRSPPSCRYAALSYVWGQVACLKLLKNNFVKLGQPKSLTGPDVPTTIADAMRLMRELGETYLWVDALCIIQDDPVSLASQLDIMGHIYSNACFAIVAASGTDANAGLPGIRENSRNVEQDVVTMDNVNLLTTVDLSNYGDSMLGSKWSTRAWTCQEEFLSKRRLIFTKQQVYWRCEEADFVEETCLEYADSSLDETQKDDKRSSSLLPRRRSKTQYFRAYQELLQNYLRRDLTVQSDRLRAFSGLLDAITDMNGDASFWGLPESVFSHWLTWDVASSEIQPSALSHMVVDSVGDQHVIPFPSWSWAAWSDSQGRLAGTMGPALLEGDVALHEPAVVFYERDAEGRTRRIKERGRELLTGVLQEQQQRWDKSEYARSANQALREWHGKDHLSDSSSFGLSLGILQFWTSSCTVTVERVSWDPHRWEFAEDLRRTMGRTVYVYFPFITPASTSSTGQGGDSTKSESNSAQDSGDTMEIELVVVSRSLSIDFLIEPQLTSLAVTWRDGVAYRRGTVRMHEHEWVKLPGREWKLVTLG